MAGCRASVLLLALCVGASLAQEAELDCYDGPFENVLLDGCVDDCQSFESLADAESHCNAVEECGGITKTSYGDNEAISLGVGLYEVRAGPGIETAKGDHSWIKQVGCAGGGRAESEAAALGDIERMVNKGALRPEGDPSGELCRSYSAPVQSKYLEGCVDECRSFETLQEAENHCDRVEDCGGVTHSLYGEGQSWHEGVGPYEVRAGPALKTSRDGDISWVRIEHDCNDDSQGGFGTWGGEYVTDVEQTETSLVTFVTWLVLLGGVFAGGVLFSYRKGHPVTVTYVDLARDALQKAVGRKVNIPGASERYESL